MNLRPLGDRVVVKPVEREEKTKSGIVLPDTAKEKPQEGIVEAVGTGRILDNGTKVRWSSRSATRVFKGRNAATDSRAEKTKNWTVSSRTGLRTTAPTAKKKK